MATLLSIETSGLLCSVCLSRNDQIIHLKESREPNAHSRVLTVFIQEIFQEAGITTKALDAIAISMGPGSYTGLRIGFSAAKGMCFGTDLPLITVDTLKALAASYLLTGSHDEDAILCPMLDARRMEVYTAAYDNQLNTILPVHALIVDADSFSSLHENRSLLFFGPGADKCEGIIKHSHARFLRDIEPSSTGVSKVANDMYLKKEFANLAYSEPFYLKEFIAGKPSNKVF